MLAIRTRGRIEGRGEFLGGLKALVGLLGQRLAHHGIHRSGNLHVEARRRQRILLEHLAHRDRGIAGERPLAGEKLIEDDADGEKIGAAVHRQSQDLLRRHVGRRAEHRADLRQFRRFDVGNAEVGDLHRAIRQQEDVRRLDVAMDHAQPMRVAERRQDLRQDAHRVRRPEALVLFEVLLELAPLDQLHRDVPDAGIFAEVVDRDDIGMRQPARGLRLAAKAREDLRRVAPGQLIRANGLERDDALDERIEGLVHDTHRAAPQFAPDFVLAELA